MYYDDENNFDGYHCYGASCYGTATWDGEGDAFENMTDGEYECYFSGYGWDDDYGYFGWYCEDSGDCYGYYWDGDCYYYEDGYYCYGIACAGTFSISDDAEYGDYDYECGYGAFGFHYDDEVGNGTYYAYYCDTAENHCYGYVCDYWSGDCDAYYVDVDENGCSYGLYYGEYGPYDACYGIYCEGSFNYYDYYNYGDDGEYSCGHFTYYGAEGGYYMEGCNGQGECWYYWEYDHEESGWDYGYGTFEQDPDPVSAYAQTNGDQEFYDYYCDDYNYCYGYYCDDSGCFYCEGYYYEDGSGDYDCQAYYCDDDGCHYYSDVDWWVHVDYHE